jgi:hypothetical protein
MTEGNGNSNSDRFDALRRYVPLAVWVIVIFVVLIIPLKIISYGYLPQDDALRHAAKAVSGKPWSEILVLNSTYKIDHEFGWNLLLEKIHQWTDWNPEPLVIFSVVFLFVLAGWSALPWLRRPEAWLIALLAAHLAAGFASRLALGRPYLISFAAVITLLLMWQKYGAAPPKKWMLALATMAFAASTFFHGVWYLWVLLLGAFIFAGQIRWAVSMGFCWVVGVFIGSALTGHPIAYPLQAVKLALLAVGMHMTQRTMALELQPFDGDAVALIILGGLLVLRQLMKLNSVPLTRNPAFWLAAFGWVLAFRVGRFWEDWGWPALLVLIVWELQSFLLTRFTEESFRRLGMTVCAAIAVFLSMTSDVGSRWTYALTKQYLEAKNPDLNGWMPGKGGIFYTADMTLFYDTFFKNPHGDWRYMLGFEPTWMPKKDFEVYHSILWNANSARAYTPWVKQMKPADRLAVRGNREDVPPIPQLEWNYPVSGIWIGRLPQTNAPPPAPTVPATASIDSLTNTPPARLSSE